MIEILLQAERALALGLIDQAERMYRQAADADPRNSIAVVGLARVALERGDEPAAWRHAQAALVIDPENVAASRLAGRLEEVWAYRGESLPEVALAVPAGVAAEPGPAADAAESGPAAESAPDPEPAEPAPDPEPAPEPPPGTAAPGGPAPAQHPSLVDRLLRRNRP